MSEQPGSETSDVEPVCSWCGRPLLPEERGRGHACERCVRKLITAGLSDGEIFGETPDK